MWSNERREGGIPLGFLSHKDKEEITQAIITAEKRTSGEIRVHVEKKGGKDPVLRAEEVFYELGMDNTKERNGVLFYLAAGERKFVILGDEGINNQVPDNFWEEIKRVMTAEFKEGRFASGLSAGIKLAGEALAQYFPYQQGDVNELPNEISGDQS